jgi:glycosyltransferase involved in cell wall biosynthesis
VSVFAPSLLLLIPAYNEENRIGPVLEDYAEYFGRHYTGKFHLVVVLNGCRDNTLGVVQGAEKRHPCISHSVFPGAIGKGGALIEGLKLAPMADLIGYVDADGATPPKAFHDLVRSLETPSVACAIASRWIPGAIVHHFQPENRRFASRLFHLFVELFFRMRILDTQCGAKVMRRHAVETIHERLTLADLAFDVNLLYSLQWAGFEIREIATEWSDKSGSKVVFNLRTSLNMLLSLVRLRLIYSPFYRWLGPLRPLEAWLYTQLRAPQPVWNDQRSDATGKALAGPKQAPTTSRSD